MFSCEQIFTNGDKVHVARVLQRLGLEDCFESIICFETLNPQQINKNDTDWDMLAIKSTIPKTPVICKPSQEAIEQALRLAKADPQRTVHEIGGFDGHFHISF